MKKNTTKPHIPLRGASFIILLLVSVILPLFTLIFELSSHICATILFDPVPDMLHISLVLLVPIANLGTCLMLRKEKGPSGGSWNIINACAIAISLLYTIAMLPVTPFAFMAIIAMGAGFIPLSPLISLIAAGCLRTRLRRAAIQNEIHWFRWWQTVIPAFLALLLLQTPSIITHIGMYQAASSNQTVNKQGLTLLKKYGQRKILLNACYGRTDIVGFIALFIHEPFHFTDGPGLSNQQEIQNIFFAITGIPFNRFRNDWLTDMKLNSQTDWNQGGDIVGRKLKGLLMAHSEVNGYIDADAGVTYTEWTIEFQNTSTRDQEARAIILLPPGGVVSRLTLWIDGEEREAAFASCETTSSAYKKVVRQRRDPVLVTTRGPNQIMLQCYPVPPQGGIMKTRIGITAPLHLTDLATGILRLPYLISGNFEVPATSTHDIDLTSSGMFFPDQQYQDSTILPLDNTWHLQASNTSWKPNQIYSVHVKRNKEIKHSQAYAETDNGPYTVEQTICKPVESHQSDIIVVVDTSTLMQDYITDVEKLCATLTRNHNVVVYLANGVPSPKTPDFNSATDARTRLNDVFDISCDGGYDNGPTLCRAWAYAKENPGCMILWIHGPQPLPTYITPIYSDLHNKTVIPDIPILAIGINSDVNIPGDKLAEYNLLTMLPNFVSTHQTIRQAESLIAETISPFTYQRSRLTTSTASTESSRTSDHLIRLYIYDTINKLLKSKKELDKEQAIKLGTEYALVTPVTGAVVLETTEQYEEAGLIPTGKAPTIVPEPTSLLLIGMGVILLFLRKHLTRPHGVTK